LTKRASRYRIFGVFVGSGTAGKPRTAAASEVDGIL
jgi:hypothetical protein